MSKALGFLFACLMLGCQPASYQYPYNDEHLIQADKELKEAIAALQNSITDLQVRQATLEGYGYVAAIVDPCTDHPTKIDEIFLRLSDGSLIASFSDNANGLNTRWSIIQNGTYSTTDGTGCTFTVSNGVVSPSIVKEF
jgi:hypothetical protein